MRGAGVRIARAVWWSPGLWCGKDQARGKIQTHAGSYAVGAMHIERDARPAGVGAITAEEMYLTNSMNKVVNNMRSLYHGFLRMSSRRT
jgi:hypothetical protein